MKPCLVALVLLLAVVAGGCDFLGRGRTAILVTGRVVVADSGVPIEGLGISLRQGGPTYGSYPLRAVARTGSDGAFRLAYDPGPVHAPLDLMINAEPYQPRYGVFRASVIRGEERDLGTVELELHDTP